MEPWKTTERRVVFDPAGGRYLTVEQHRVELPSGQVIDDWLWVRTPDFVNALVSTVDNDFLVFRQTKYAVPGTTLAVVGGYIEPGEDPADAARREITEETGWICTDLVSLGSYATDGNRGVGVGHLYLGRGATPLTDDDRVDSDDLEEQELLLLTRDELLRALQAGEFGVVSWAATVAMGLLRNQDADVGG